MKTEQFLLTVKSLFTVELKNLKNSVSCFKAYLRREETLQPSRQLTKMPRNEAKICQVMDFLSTKGHLLTSPGCCLT